MLVNFTANEIASVDMEIDRNSDLPAGLFQKLVSNDLLGLMLPAEFGSAGFDPIATAQGINDLVRGNASVAVTLEGHFKTIDQLLKFGFPELQARYLKSATKRIFAFLMTEASGGSNPLGVSTWTVRQGNK